MINCEFSMSDTLDNFSFNALKSQQVENNSDISDTVSFNDSQFFENCSFDFEAVCNEEVSESVSFVNDKNKSPPLSVARLKTDSLLSQHDCTMSQIVSSNRTQITTLQKETSLDKPKNTVLTLDLSSWNLPETVLNKYIKRNVKTMFQWQFDCLTNPKVLYDQWNLIYSAPTSAGKTLVAEILALKTIFNRKKKKAVE
ncbi:hypothetical protein ABEB36_004573 [Hypothenemus hampei]|uniref:Uncharacterized protein n=1 Tax=Hypothenemus hampei TaxID=57062 RepID=A0ABD1F3U0_HYPHA